MKRLLGLIIVAALGFYVAWPAWSGYKIAQALSASDAGALESKIDFPAVRESLRPVVAAEMGKRIDKEMQNLGPLAQSIGGDLKKKMQGQLVDQVLATIVTPANVIKIAHDGGDIAKSVEKVLAETAGQLGAVAGGGAPAGGATAAGAGGLGGLLGGVLGGATGAAGAAGTGGVDIGGLLGKALGGAKKPAEAAPAAPAAADPKTAAAGGKRSYGLGNLKGFGFEGPLSFYASVAKDASAPKADGTVGMSFTGGDWKLTRVVPNL
jgi:Protein of unknown function (DUF2939)